MKNKLLFLALVATILLSTGVYAEPDTSAESSIVTDESALFGGDETGDEPVSDSTASLEDELFGGGESTKSSNGTIEEAGAGTSLIQEGESGGSIASTLLVSESVEIGGSYRFSASGTWNWDDPETLWENLFAPSSDSAGVELGATIFFDARPDEDFRVFGKTTISSPFTADDEARTFSDVIHVDELFSDFTWNDALFFRGGKHTINWGVGYFFSPADLLNITEIDPEDPEAEREGPVSLKIQYPFGNHNAYLYGIARGVEFPDEFGIAAKTEFVLGGMELGIGGLYQKDVAPSAMLTASIPFADIDFFGEAVVRYGSDRTFIEESDESMFGVKAVTNDVDLFFNGTAGFSFLKTFDSDDSSLFFVAQYRYNDEGYDDPTLITDNAIGVAALIEAGEISYDDLVNTGKHYTAVSGSWNDLFGSVFSVNALWMHNYTDASGFVSPALTAKLFDELSISIKTPYRYGDEGGEYTPKPAGDSFSVEIGVGMGEGRF
jgi:hypothetical protein